MSVFLSGANDVETIDLVTAPYNGINAATFLVWFQTSDNNQNSSGLYALLSRSDGTFHQAFGIGFDYVAPLSPGRLSTEIYRNATGRSYWERTAQITANALTCVGLVYTGGGAATQVNRHRTYVNGVEDTANGTFSGVVPSATIGPIVDGLLRAGIWFDNPNETRYTGCICACASWAGLAASPAQMAEAFALGPGGNFIASTLGQPSNWMRFASTLDDEGTDPFTWDWNGLPIGAFGCPGGDPSCDPSPLVSPLDADFFLRVRRFK